MKRAMENIREALSEVIVPNAKVAEIVENGNGIDIRFVYSGKNQVNDIVDQNLLRLIPYKMNNLREPFHVGVGQCCKKGAEFDAVMRSVTEYMIRHANVFDCIASHSSMYFRQIAMPAKKFGVSFSIFVGEERFESFEFAPALLDTFLSIAKSEIPDDADFAEYRQYCIDEFAQTVKRSHAPARYNFPYASVVSPEVWIAEYKPRRDRNQAQLKLNADCQGVLDEINKSLDKIP
jgi:hypothetical protein